MKKKSKFITFILSFLPGLSHFYLGYADRGLIYLIIFGGLGVGSIGLTVLSGVEAFMALFIIGASIIWLVALIDSFSIINSMRHGNDNSPIEDSWNSEETKASNKKAISLALSIIPGAGHMYLGYQQKGLALMGGFFFTIFFMGWLQLSMLVFILPLIWFYSFFDAFHTLNGNDVEDIDISRILPPIKHEYIGFGLIGIGLLIALQRVLYPVMQEVLYSIFENHIVYQIKNYIQAGIVSLIFIIGGIKMLSKKKVEESIKELEGETEDEE